MMHKENDMKNRLSIQPRVYTAREWRIRQITRWTLAVIGIAALIAAVVTAAHTIRLRPAHPEEQAEVQVCEAAPTAAAEILATVCEADRDYETYVEGSGPAPDWYRPWEPMCAEWSAVDGSVDKTVDDAVDGATDIFVGDTDVLCNAEPHPPVGIDPGGVDWNICSTLWGWDGHTMEIWEMDLFARIMYLEFWGTSWTCCEAGADSILRLWESGYFGRTIFETLSAVSENGALVYTTYGFVWDVEYDPAGLSEMRELCEERFSHGPEWCAPFFQLYEYPSWATPCYEIDGVFFSTSPWLEG